MKFWTNFFLIRMKLRINLARRLRLCKVTKVVNMNHYLVDIMENKKLSTKLLHLILLNRMEQLNENNRTLKNMMNATLVSSDLPQNMWGEAILTANYILNIVPGKKLHKTPYELFKDKRPTYNYLQT